MVKSKAPLENGLCAIPRGFAHAIRQSAFDQRREPGIVSQRRANLQSPGPSTASCRAEPPASSVVHDSLRDLRRPVIPQGIGDSKQLRQVSRPE
jgi:hypothetical protein